MPTKEDFQSMWNRNKDGGGYMYARDGKVHISKGYMDFESYMYAIENEKFTKDDVVVFHTRIGTQAGVNPQMTHPYPLTKDLEMCKKLDLVCQCGVAHNGIIPMTTNPNEKEYNDTCLFITKYLVKLVRKPSDLLDDSIKDMIELLTNSKWALLDGSGQLMLVGNWIEKDGLMYSNNYHFDFDYQWNKYLKRFSTIK